MQAFRSSAVSGGLASLGNRLTVRRLLAAALLIAATLPADEAAAQCARRCDPLTGQQIDTVNPGQGRFGTSAHAALIDLGTRYLQRLTDLSSFRTAASSANNPQGGGAESDDDRYRLWLEGYGIRAVTRADATFTGDHRKTYGGVAGIGVKLAPDVHVGLSVDQGQSIVGINQAIQSGRIDLTQIGLLASVDQGPWNLSATAITAFGQVHSSRFDFAGTSTAAYGASMSGVMAELSYYWTLPGNVRVVPKLTFDWLHWHTDAFAEAGGEAPISGSAVSSQRFRLMLGAELGRSWLVDRRILDISVYGRLVDNVSQQIGSLQIALTDVPNVALLVSGIRESTLGADAGAALSAKVTDMMRLYLVYDGRYRSNLISHGGTVGAEFRF